MLNERAAAYRVAMVIALGGFVFGFDASVISGVVGFVAREFNLNDLQTGLVVSSPTLGAMIASMVAGPVSDAIGRRRVLLIIATLYLLSALVSALAPGYYTLVGARFLGGLAFSSLIIAPIYIAELAPSQLRGRLVSFNQLNIVVGFSAAYFANYLFLRLSGLDAAWVQWLMLDSQSWRWMLGVEALPAALYVLMLLRVPESPRWLIMHNRLCEAEAVMAQLTPDENFHAKLQEFRRQGDVQPVWQRFKALFSPKMRLILVVALVVGIAQQITGINAIYFYAPTIFEQSGVGTDAAFAQAIWIGVINVIFTLLAMATIDKLGRKPLLLIGLASVAISLGVCAYGFKTASYQLDEAALSSLSLSPAQIEQLQPIVGQPFADDAAYKLALKNQLGEAAVRDFQSELIQAAISINPTLVLVGILGFVAAFAMSLGPVMWVLFSEIFPNQLRGMAISFVGVINSTVSFFVQLLFPWQLTELGAATTFFIYVLFALLALLLTAWLLPETKGKCLEQLEQDLAGGIRRPRNSSSQLSESLANS